MQVVNAASIQRVLIVYAVAAMTVIGLAVATATILPLQSRMERAAESAFEYALDLQTEALGERVARLRDLARQVTSRRQ